LYFGQKEARKITQDIARKINRIKTRLNLFKRNIINNFDRICQKFKSNSIIFNKFIDKMYQEVINKDNTIGISTMNGFILDIIKESKI
jgi:hypothetical protein